MQVCVYSILPGGWGLSVGTVLLCLAQKPRPCSRAWRGLWSLGGGTQRSPLAQLRVYTPQGSPSANTEVLPAVLWSLVGRPSPCGSLHDGQTLKGPRRFPVVQDPQWATRRKMTVVKLERRGILWPVCHCLSVKRRWVYLWWFISPSSLSSLSYPNASICFYELLYSSSLWCYASWVPCSTRGDKWSWRETRKNTGF